MSYPIEEQNLERQRLLARVLEPITKHLLDGLRLRPDSVALILVAASARQRD
jgi:hypothetical protein